MATLQDLELDLAPRIAAIEMTDGEREAVLQYMHARTKALVPPRGVPVNTVRQWLTPRKAVALTFPHVTPQGAPRLTLANLQVVLSRMGWTCRYDVIHKRQDVLGAADETLRDNRDNVTLSRVISACGEFGLPQRERIITGFICATCDANPYNPVQVWLDSKPWDGRSRFEELFNTLTLDGQQDAELARLILRKWLIQCVAVALSPVPIQARGVLSLPGPQNIGKSRWFQRLVNGGPDGLVATGRIIVPNEKDTVLLAITAWICELGELDTTMRKADQGALKGFLAQDIDTIRLPFAAKPSEFQRRTCFVASVNEEHFLVDETGNTRFWPIAVTGADHMHSVDMQQLWAEMAEAWRGGETHYFQPPEMKKVEQASQRHREYGPVHEDIRDTFPWPAMPEGRTSYPEELAADWPVMSATKVLRRCGYKTVSNGQAKSAGRALKRLGAIPVANTGGGRGWKVPPLPGGLDGGFDD